MITTDQLHRIADAAAGDARAAIGTLKAAARRANHAQTDQITDEIISEAVPEAKSEIQRKTLEKLTKHQAVLYEIIADAEKITPSNLYDQYQGRVDDPKSDRMVRNYLQKMAHYNLINCEGKNRGRTYTVANTSGEDTSKACIDT